MTLNVVFESGKNVAMDCTDYIDAENYFDAHKKHKLNMFKKCENDLGFKIVSYNIVNFFCALETKDI